MYSLSRHLHPVCRCHKFPFHPTSLILKPPIQSIGVNAISPQPILPPKTKESEVLIRVNAISPQPFPLPQAGESEVLMRGGSGGKTESTLSGLYWSTTLMCIGSDQTDHWPGGEWSHLPLRKQTKMMLITSFSASKS